MAFVLCLDTVVVIGLIYSALDCAPIHTQHLIKKNPLLIEQKIKVSRNNNSFFPSLDLS